MPKSRNDRYLLIVNPAAGGGAGKDLAPQLIEKIRGHGAEIEAEFSSSLSNATELAQAAAAEGKIAVAVGGDGLISSVVNGAARIEGSTIGIVPFGTANDFARVLGISKDTAVTTLLEGTAQPVDLGLAAGRFFTCIASVGFDSTVLESSLRIRLIKGPLIYPYAVVKSLFSWKPQPFIIEHDGQTRSFVGFSVAAANAGTFGGGMKLAPHARLDDGMFDVVLIKGTSKSRFLRYAPSVFHGGHVRSPDVEIFRTSKLKVTTADPFLVYADGEVLAPAPLELEVKPSALRVLVSHRSVS